MQSNNNFYKWWVTPKFPVIHYMDNVGWFKFWIANPVKRWVSKYYLVLLQKFTEIKVIGITGSAGKTTTKEMLASILKLEGGTVYSPANIDPIYNIPNTILNTPPGTKYLILEMGVEYPNEMDFYLWLARPNIGVITNIFPTHLEFLKDVNGVLHEKSKLVLNLGENDIAVLNSNDNLLRSLKPKLKSKIIWFQNSGDQLDRNSSAAKSVAENLGVSKEKISRGLMKYTKPVHRLTLIKLKTGANVLDDSYNSNPYALSETIKYFVKIAGKNKKIAVLGDMKELGEFEEELHRKIGREISGLSFSVVIGVGSPIKYLINEVGKNVKTQIVSGQEDVLPLLKPYLQKGNYILIKGSRSIGLDKLVDQLPLIN